jgi:hypothetical protein
MYLGTFSLQGTLTLCNATNLDYFVFCRFVLISLFAQRSTIFGNMHIT